MFCSLNSENGQQALLDLISYVSSVLESIASVPGAKFDIEQFMKDMYQQVYSNSKSHDQAVDVTRMLPEITLVLAPKDRARLISLVGKGLDLSMIGQMMINAGNEVSGVKYIEDIVGVSVDPVTDIKNTIKDINTSQDVIDQKIDEAEKKDDVEDAPGPVNTGDYLRDADGNPIVVEEPEEAPVSNKKADIERRKALNGIEEIVFSNSNFKLEGFEIDGNYWNVVTSTDRAKVLVNVNGVIVPFYLTTGQAGKGLIPGWYPFFGIGKDGWLNKTDKSDMETYYERYWGKETAAIVKSISEELNSFYGTDPSAFKNDGDPTATSKPLSTLADKVEDYINSKLSYTPAINDSNARKTLRNNVEQLGKEIQASIKPETEPTDIKAKKAESEKELFSETDSKGRTNTVFSNTKEKDGLIKTTFTFNRSDKDPSQRNKMATGIPVEKALGNKYTINEEYIPEGAKVVGVSEIRISKTGAGATVTFEVDGETYQGEVTLNSNTTYDAELAALEQQETTRVSTPYTGQRFNALADTGLKDTDQEAISDKEGEEGYNVVDKDPRKRLNYSVKRKIVRLLNNTYNGSEIDYPGVGPVFLRAQSSSTIPAERLHSRAGDVVLVVVDSDGKPVRFDDAGNVNPSGNVAYYPLPKPHDVQAPIEQKRIASIVQRTGMSIEAVVTRLEAEKKVVLGILDYVMQSPSTNTVTLDITGGTLGYLGSQKESYTLSKINLKGAPVRISQAKGDRNVYEMTIEDVSSDPIRISNPEMRTNKNLMDLLADLIVNDVFFPSGAKMSMSQKKDKLELFAYLSTEFKNRMDIKQGKLFIDNAPVDLSTEENKAKAKEMIIRAFSEPFYSKILSEEQVREKINNGYKIVDFIFDAKQGDIILTKDLEGKDVYQAVSYPGMYISKKLLNLKEGETLTATFFNLEKDQDGKMVIKPIENGYINNYIFENFTADRQLNADNELVPLNAYLTFTPLSYEQLKITEKRETSDPLVDTLKSVSPAAAKQYEDMTYAEKEAFKITEVVEQTKTPRQSTAKLATDILADKFRSGDYKAISKEEALEIMNELSKAAGLKKTHITQLTSLIDQIYKPIKSSVNADPIISEVPEVEPNEIELDEVVTKEMEVDPPTLTDQEINDISNTLGSIDVQTSGRGTQLSDEDIEDNDEYNKLIQQVDKGEVITAEQLREAEEWFKKSPLSKVFSFREAYNLVNSRNPNSVAQWTHNGIILFKGSNLTDLYHEAFHGFTQAFMTPTQRKELYNAVRAKSGTFTTYKGQVKSFSEATDKEAEEFLAEDFRKWMLAGAKKTALTKYTQVERNFFQKLFDILKALFGKYTINDIVSGDRANAFIEDIYEKLSLNKIDEGGYKFSVANMNQGFKVLYKAPHAINDSLEINKAIPFLNHQQTKLLMDSVDAWIAESVLIAMTGKSEQEAIKFFEESIAMFVEPSKLTPGEIEQRRLKIAPDLNYGQVAKYLKTEKGRIKAYEDVRMMIGKTYNEVYKKFEELKAKTSRTPEEQLELESLTSTSQMLWWAWNNFGDLTNLNLNVADKDGIYKGVIAYHLANSETFGKVSIAELDAIDQEESGSKSPYTDKSGNETSLYDLAKEKAEIKFLFKTIYRIDPKTGLPIRNDLGAPELMDFKKVWNKVALLLENTSDPAVMYNKLLKFAMSKGKEDRTEMTYAIAQVVNKLGPKGLSKIDFPKSSSIDAENMWTSFWSIFSNTRIALQAMTATIVKDKNTGQWVLESRIGRGINANARVGKKWDSDFQIDPTNKYRFVEDGVPIMNLKKIIKDFSDLINIVKTDINNLDKVDPKKVFDFLDALGIKFARNEDVTNSLRYGNEDYTIRNGYHILKTLLSERKDILNSLDAKGERYDKKLSTIHHFDRKPSFIEILANDPNIVIQRPSDLFRERTNVTVSVGESTYVIKTLKGEMSNWNELQLIEGQFGSGVPTFMATTADGNTQFEHSLPSTMSVMVNDVNAVEEYDQLLELPHLRHLHYRHNPSARHYEWIKQMFHLDPTDSTNYGKRRVVNGIKVKLVLNNISGAKVDERDGVSSAKADPFTKFILDIHLMTQVGLPELMRHSDKSTSYSVTLNIQQFVGDKLEQFTKPEKGAMYMPNVAFLQDQANYHTTFYNSHIIPNLAIELERIVRLTKKENEIKEQLKKIREQKKAGLPVDPMPVFDLDFLKAGKKFLSFQGILNNKTKSELLKKYTAFVQRELNAEVAEYEIDIKKFLEENAALNGVIVSETQDYFKKLLGQSQLTFEQSGKVMAKNVLDVFREKNPDATRMSTDEELTNALLAAYTYNTWTHNIESMNVLYGDPAAYNHAKEDFHKRNAGIASTGTGYRVDNDMLDTIHSTLGGRKFENKYREGSSIAKREAYDGTMNTGVMKDKVTRSVFFEEIGYNLYKQMKEKELRTNSSLPESKRKSEKEIDKNLKIRLFGKDHANIKITNEASLKGVEPDKKSIMHSYNKMQEADAQGWISFDAYRILAFSQGEWTPGHEKLYNDMLEGKEIDQSKVSIFFPPIKAQYWGPLATESQRIDAFHKFQLTPIVPSLAALSPKLNQLNEKMMKEGIDYVLFESGSKMGTLTKIDLDSKNNLIATKDNIYDNDTREITDESFTVNKIFVKYLKNQLKIAPKFKGKISFPTQIRKIIETGLMENGVPTDYAVNLSPEERIQAWDKLSPAWKLTYSDNWKKIVNYEMAVMRLTSVKRSQLFSQADLKLDETTGKVTGKLENIVKYIKKNLSADDLADHELDFIDVDPHTGKMVADLSYSLSSELIESVLNTLIIKSLVRQKVNGEALIQVSGAMLESEPQFKEPTEEQLKKYGTNGLSFNRLREDGKFIEAMKIKIAMQGDFENLLYLNEVAVYRDKIKNGKTVVNNGKIVRELDYNASLANLNRLIKDETWLNTGENRKLVSTNGVRIPTQSENADVYAEIYEFLPREEGNIIIVPAEIVAQSGGDFDIDKLTLMFPNISREIMSFSKEGQKIEYSVGLYKATPTSKLRENYEAYKIKKAEDYILGDKVYENKNDRRRELELHKRLAGPNIIEQTINDLLKEGEIVDWETFALADLEKAAQNDVMFSMIDILKKPAAYVNLVRPNGTDILDPIVEKAKEVFRGYRPDVSTNDEALEGPIQVSRIYEPIYNLFKHYTNNSSKAGVGIGAIDITYNEIFNRVGMYLTPNNREFVEGLESDSPILKEAMELVRQRMLLESDQTEITKIRNEKKARRAEAASVKKIAELNKNDLKTDEEKAQYSFYFMTAEELKREKLIENEIQELNSLFNKFQKEKGYNAEEIVSKFVRQTLYLPHNTMKVKDALGKEYADEAISLSHTTDVFGENQISDTLSQLENGWLDAAKDPWIFYLRGNEALAPYILFLVQAGVPINHAIQFISQPVIVDFMETIVKLQSQFGQMMDLGEGISGVTRNKAKLKAKQLMLQKLGYDLSNFKEGELNKAISRLISLESVLLKPENGEFDLKDLIGQNKHVHEKYNLFDKTGNVILENLNIDYSDPKLSNLQKQIFLHFLQISDMQDAIRDVKMATNVDTNPSKSLVSVQAVISKLKEIKRTKTEGDIEAMKKYWRIPSEPIEKMIPTIKLIDEKTGKLKDTGNLDESKIQSPIGSFYVQPIQNYLWSPLFPLKSNTTINNFVESLGFLDKDSARNDTWLSDDEGLITEFKNSLAPIIFQNEFLTFDTSKLLAIDLEPVTYRDAFLKVDKGELSKVIALPVLGAVAKFENGEPTIYFDYNTLYNQYTNGDFAKEGYGGELNLQILDASMFSSFGEYVKFVFEREYLRAQYADLGGKKTIDKLLKENPVAKSIYADTASTVRKGDYASETERTKARKRLAFEKFITQQALKNTYNLRALFHGDTAYVFEVFDIKNDPAYQGLVDQFDIFDNLVPDSETSAKGSNRINIAFIESVNDTQTINSYYEQVKALSDSAVLSKLNRTKKLGLTPDQLRHVETVFKKLPIVAFLQSGMSPHGRFSFNRIVNENVVRLMNQDATDRFISQIELEELSYPDDPQEKYKTLKTIWNAFVKGNKRYDVRGKNYIIDKSKNGKPVLNLEDIRIINSNLNPNEALFDPEFIQSNGLPSNGFIKEGDVIPVSIDLYGVKNYSITVETISYEDGFVTVEGKTAGGAPVKLLFSINGKLKNVWTSKKNDKTGVYDPYNKSQKTILKDLTVSKYFIKDVIGDQKVKYLEEGDNISGTFLFASGGKINSRNVSFAVSSVEDLGFEYNKGVQIEESHRYLVKGDMTFSGEKVTQKALVVTSDGSIIGEIYKGKFNRLPIGGFVNATLNTDRKSPSDDSLVFYSKQDIKNAVSEGKIIPGQILEYVDYHPDAGSALLRSRLYVYDASAGEVNPYSDIYEDFLSKEEDLQELLEKEKKFIVYNGALNPQETIEQTSRSSEPLEKPSKKGVELKDKFVHYGDFNLKVGLTTRKRYGGGRNAEYFEDIQDRVEMKNMPDPDAVKAIDAAIESIKLKIAQGYTPIFNQAGYGQYMIGANDDTGKVYIGGFTGQEKVGQVVAYETFKYLSNRLLEVGFVNPNFVKEAEGVPAIVAATKQPATEEDIVELMKKCFLI